MQEQVRTENSSIFTTDYTSAKSRTWKKTSLACQLRIDLTVEKKILWSNNIYERVTAPFFFLHDARNKMRLKRKLKMCILFQIQSDRFRFQFKKFSKNLNPLKLYLSFQQMSVLRKKSDLRYDWKSCNISTQSLVQNLQESDGFLPYKSLLCSIHTF